VGAGKGRSKKRGATQRSGITCLTKTTQEKEKQEFRHSVSVFLPNIVTKVIKLSNHPDKSKCEGPPFTARAAYFAFHCPVPLIIRPETAK
jgi:hypothetical protein